MVLLNILLFVVGLILLIKGADFFIKAAASIAKKLGVSEFVIGLTLVALATSLPELAASIASALKNESGIIIGNVVGSNIANIGLIVGLGAALRVIKTNKEMLKRDGYIMLFAALLFLVFIIDGSIGRFEAGFFLLLYVSYMMFLFSLEKEVKEKYHFKEFLIYFFKFRYITTIRSRILARKKKNKHKVSPQEKKKIKKLFTAGLVNDFIMLIVGGGVIVLGANYVISEAIFFANLLGISSTLIGISLIALGTSLPELSVSLRALGKGYGNIAIGNIIGSNIANIFLILGVSGLMLPLEITKSVLFFSAPFMIFISALLLLFMRKDWKVSRYEGLALILLYILFMIVLFFGIPKI